MVVNAWQCARGSMNKSQGRGMRNKKNETCQKCPTCCGANSVGVHAVSSTCTEPCNDNSNCPGRAVGRVVAIPPKKSSAKIMHL